MLILPFTPPLNFGNVVAKTPFGQKNQKIKEDFSLIFDT